MRFLLDTHIVLWAIAGDRQLPKVARDLLANPDTLRFVSIASLWEIAIKKSTGKLMLDSSLDAFAERLVDDLGATILPIRVEHLLVVERLPWHHRDPFDRLMLAQAASEGLRMVSVDRLFAPYGVDITTAEG